jgi:hypothetical protein
VIHVVCGNAEKGAERMEELDIDQFLLEQACIAAARYGKSVIPSIIDASLWSKLAHNWRDST